MHLDSARSLASLLLGRFEGVPWFLSILQISFTPKIGANFFFGVIESLILKTSIMSCNRRDIQSKKLVTANPALARFIATPYNNYAFHILLNG